MTADEFRGFIVNLVINGAVAAALAADPPHWATWGYILLGIALWLIAPITPYHPKPAKERTNR